MPTIRRHLLALTVIALAVPAATTLTTPVQAAAPAPSATTPTGFVELPTTPLPADHATHTITVSYRNPSAVDRTVAPQILIESPASGPFVTPADISLAVLDPMATGSPSGSAARPAPCTPT